MKTENFTLEKAIVIAASRHEGQTDKAGFPYILHPLRVMMSVDGLLEKMTAVLHDVIEDTTMTFEELRELGCPNQVIAALRLLTKGEGENPKEYILRIVESGNPIALKVKWKDINDNSDPYRLQYLPIEKQQYLGKKYAEAKKLIMENS